MKLWRNKGAQASPYGALKVDCSSQLLSSTTRLKYSRLKDSIQEDQDMIGMTFTKRMHDLIGIHEGS